MSRDPQDRGTQRVAIWVSWRPARWLAPDEEMPVAQLRNQPAPEITPELFDAGAAQPDTPAPADEDLTREKQAKPEI